MRILFEDNYLLAIDKPAGLSSESGGARHPSAEKEARGVISDEGGGDISRRNRGKSPTYLRAVHRLDRTASGVLLLAKTKTALSNLMAQFERHTVEKVYLAGVARIPPAGSGTLRHFLKRAPDGKSAEVFDTPVEGSQMAELSFRVLEKKGAGGLLEIFPATGRFHQIRAQLAHIGCPIDGDTRYGGPFWQENAIKLHARRLRVRHPKSGEMIVLEAPVPENW